MINFNKRVHLDEQLFKIKVIKGVLLEYIALVNEQFFKKQKNYCFFYGI